MDTERYKIQLPTFTYPDNLSEERIWHPELLNVLNHDRISIRKCMYQMALYFKREEGYDFVQYSKEEESNNKHKAFLFRESIYSIKCCAYGGFVMRYRDEYTDLKPHWGLQWIWLHPYKRNRGLFSSIIPFLQEKFGDFHIEGPLSKAMEGLIKKLNLTDIHYNYERLKININPA